MADLLDIEPLPPIRSEWKKEVPYQFNGLVIVLEYLAGEYRTKTKNTGITITNKMPSAYGRILGTNDIHGEEIDVYLCSTPDDSADVYVIDQVNPQTKIYDEHKVMLGFTSSEDAARIYMAAFNDGSGESRLGAITSFDPKAFSDWLAYDGSSLQPASKYGMDGVSTLSVSGINTPVTKHDTPPIDEAGGVVINLPDLSKGHQLNISSSTEGSFDYTLYLYSALNVTEWSNTIDTFCRTLDLATNRDTMHIHLVSPGGSVVLLGRILSAISSTKAKVITYAEGEVASAATAIWAAGHERHILPGAYFMQHMSSQILSGKTTDIATKSIFCMDYVKRNLAQLITIGLFTDEEVSDMIERSADVYVSGTDAIARIAAKGA